MSECIDKSTNAGFLSVVLFILVWEIIFTDLSLLCSWNKDRRWVPGWGRIEKMNHTLIRFLTSYRTTIWYPDRNHIACVIQFQVQVTGLLPGFSNFWYKRYVQLRNWCICSSALTKKATTDEISWKSWQFLWTTLVAHVSADVPLRFFLLFAEYWPKVIAVWAGSSSWWRNQSPESHMIRSFLQILYLILKRTYL